MGEYADMAIDAEIDAMLNGCDDTDWGRGLKTKDPLYYHNYHPNTTLVETTEEAYLIKFNDGRCCWIPKSLCKEMTDTSVYIWQDATFTSVMDMKPI